jgi:hypothetical protein
MDELFNITKESYGLINFSPLGEPYTKWAPVYKNPDEPDKIVVEYPAIDSCYGLGVDQVATWIMEYFTQLPNRGVIMYAVMDKGLGGAGHPHDLVCDLVWGLT